MKRGTAFFVFHFYKDICGTQCVLITVVLERNVQQILNARFIRFWNVIILRLCPVLVSVSDLVNRIFLNVLL